ncbi:segregation and condensation protein A [Thermotalea metallivorans]|uniref:Segregation and condensation protein A n=1 Tax=Thermotalea metallivorans TaxID=520762 RepID=A0A140L8F5_9FIRM|nr:segregation/condensation protein A [Thermotalea metallivorans]KXG76830.1 Segregation and condensation protein A [Thermotalea metallivorans]
MSYNVKLESFEGPFDLLFHLIEKAEVDIYNIPIAQITDQYIQYIHDMQKFDLEVTSEFLVMAATLVEIKSKMLLPHKHEEQLTMAMDEMDPRQELITRLIEYKKYKSAADEFKKREEVFKKVFYRPQEQLDQFIRYDDIELVDLDIRTLLDAFNNLLRKKKSHGEDKIYASEIHRDEITIEDKIHQIKEHLHQNGAVRFDHLFSDPYNKSEIVVTFLALLELIKLRFLIVQQDKIFGHIIVKKLRQ